MTRLPGCHPVPQRRHRPWLLPGDAVAPGPTGRPGSLPVARSGPRVWPALPASGWAG